MNEATVANLTSLFLALSDSTRLKLISLMADGEVSVGYLAESVGESQPKVSRHLAYLRTAGLVATRREGKHIFYSIDWPEGEIASHVMNAVLGNRPRSSVENHALIDDHHPTSTPTSNNAFDETYMNDYKPQEIEIYLL